MKYTTVAIFLLFAPCIGLSQAMDSISSTKKNRKFLDVLFLRNKQKSELPVESNMETEEGQILDIIYEIDTVSERVIFSDVREVSHLSSEEMFLLCKLWLDQIFKPNSDVLSSEDINNGVLLRHGWIDIQFQTTIRMYFTIRIDTKDGRYRMQFYDISYKSYKTDSQPSYEFEAEYYFDNPRMVRRSGQEKPIARKYIQITSSTINQLQESLYQELLSASVHVDW